MSMCVNNPTTPSTLSSLFLVDIAEHETDSDSGDRSNDFDRPCPLPSQSQSVARDRRVNHSSACPDTWELSIFTDYLNFTPSICFLSEISLNNDDKSQGSIPAGVKKNKSPDEPQKSGASGRGKRENLASSFWLYSFASLPPLGKPQRSFY